ncbi:helix-turn-helix transcriptional regulator [Spirilliplanes yamanashiensis]|uniref:DNA-binding response regulator n=1 Tax=Spirilliplanes yamanashiensis TaxID=42233 RepID=A0A8J3YAA1_9ACTN|nr:response regulator transcription factor [Spirilliplanes yamanashiensis]MDP9818110.1 two-component system response regulator DesR [Spirilliplanes yamanashiensis]GIJ04921.1 DNA-binding response regulator [Spirilliplanes yamanashiensis]
MTRVLVVTDGGRSGSHVRALLGVEPDIDIVGTLPFDGDLAVRAAELWPKVVVIDTEYMVSQVLPVAAELRARIPGVSMLLLCDPTKRGMLPPRRRAGDLSFLLKDASPALLADSVRRLAGGERIVHPRLQAASLNTERGLSTRELEVLGLAAEGESVADIAHRLYLSGGTVRNYLSAVIMKTGARNRLDAIRIARKDGWLR